MSVKIAAGLVVCLLVVLPVPMAEAHGLTVPSAERYLTRYVEHHRAVLENPEDPAVPGASTTVIDSIFGCRPRNRKHPHALSCAYAFALVVAPIEGSSVRFALLYCGDVRVQVKFRSRRSRRLKVTSDNFRCYEERGTGAPPGASVPSGTPPPVETGPPPPPP
jgi:hypothetical protein